MQLIEHLANQVNFITKYNPQTIGGYHSTSDFVLKNAISFNNARCPPQYLKGAEFKRCFYNAYRLARKHNLVYVEGFALGMIPIHHAWVVAPGSHDVIDPTWRYADDHEYFGVPIKIDYMKALHKRSKLWTAIDCWTLEWPIFTDNREMWYDDRASKEPADSLSCLSN